jgi:hypothetical protein
MNLSFEWKITNVIKKESLNDLQDVIMRIVFEYKGTDADSGESYTMLGGLDLNPPSSENFTAITELTKEQVLSWLDSHPDVPKLQKNIEGCIQSQINMNDIKQATEISWIETNNLSVEPTQNVEIDPEIK